MKQDDKRPEISFDILSPTEFEEFVYELLIALGFHAVNWRKGTGFDASPADQGRDIECKCFTKTPDGNQHEERWFVECKHYKQGVPPKELQSAIAWAQAERPNNLLLVASNFLSNQSKNYLAEYQQNNRPPFRIEQWELPKLRALSAIHTQLLRKFGLLGEFPLLSILHPFHIRYMKLPPFNSMEYFFGILDDLDPIEREDMIGHTMTMIVNPRFRDVPPDYKGTLGELMIDKVDYPTFKDKCLNFADNVGLPFVVPSIVNATLQYLLHLGDTTGVGATIEKQRILIRRLRAWIEENNPRAKIAAEMIPDLEKRIEEMPDHTRINYGKYVAFCEKVIGPLFDEQLDLQIPTSLKNSVPK